MPISFDRAPAPVVVALECEPTERSELEARLRALSKQRKAELAAIDAATSEDERSIAESALAVVDADTAAAAALIPTADDTRTQWSVRPLTPAELAGAVRIAGPVPVRGRRVLQAEREGSPIETPEDAEAADEARQWVMRHHEALVCAALVAVDGEPVADAAALLQSIRPASLHPSVVLELGHHVQELSDLSPKERASYGLPSGSGGTGGAEGGSATNAKTGPC